MIQSRDPSQDILPKLEDNDFISQEGITVFKACVHLPWQEIAFDSESSDDNIATLNLPQVWITELKISTVYSKRDSSLTMDVAAN